MVRALFAPRVILSSVYRVRWYSDNASPSTIQYPPVNILTVTAKTVALIEKNDFDGAMEYFKRAIKHGMTVKPNQVTFSRILDALKKYNEIERMRMWMTIMVKRYRIQPNTFHTSIFLEALGKTSPHEAQRYFDSLEHKEEIHYTLMIKTLKNHSTNANSLKQAETLFEEMKANIRPSTSSWGSMISFYANKAKDSSMMEKAEKLYHDLINSGVTPNTRTINVMIDGYANCVRSDTRMMQKAEKLFDEITNLGCIPDLFTYSTMIKGYVNGTTIDNRMIHKAEKLFDELVHHKHIKPDVITVNTMITGYVRSAKTDRTMMDHALKMVEDMVQTGGKPTTVTFTQLITGFANLGDDVQALKMFELMRNHGITPSLAAYNALLRAHGNAGNLDEARKMFDNIVYKDAIIYSTMIDILFKNELFSEGAQLFENMNQQRVKPHLATLTTMISNYLKSGMVNEAMKIYEDMEKIYHLAPDTFTNNTILSFLCHQSAFNEGLILFNSMTKKDAATYSILISYIVNNKLHIDSDDQKYNPGKYIRDMIDEGLIPTYSLLRIFAKWAYLDGGDEGKKLLANVLTQFEMKLSVSTYPSILKGLLDLRRFDEAWRLFETLEEKDKYVYGIMINGCIENGRDDLVDTLLEQMEKNGIEEDHVMITILEKRKKNK
jgi:pentatricopeptide repeat protein